jgi:hypothetical protein
VADALQAFLAVLDARTLADVLPPPHALDRAMREVRVDLPARKRIPAGPAAEDVA